LRHPRHAAAALLAAAWLVLPARGFAQHTDWLHVVEDGALVAGITDYETVTQTVGVRALHVRFPSGYLTNSPGWTGASSPPAGYSPLPGNTALSFNVVVPPTLGRNFSYWNGVGAVAFGPLPNGERLRFQQNSTFNPGDVNAIATGGSSQVPGFAIATTSPTGFLHHHIHYRLLGNGVDLATNGVYLVSVEATMPGLADSLPMYVVYNQGGTDAAGNLALEWVNANLVSTPVPVLPGAARVGLALALLLGLALALLPLNATPEFRR